MKRFDTKEVVAWLLSGILVSIYLLMMSVDLGNDTLYGAWTSLTLSSGQYRYLAEVAIVFLGGVLLAGLLYTLAVAELKSKAEMEARYRKALEAAYTGTLHALTSALDLRDDETYGHSKRVMGYSLAMGQRLGLAEEQMQTLAWGALLHDLGKIGIRDDILLKPGVLTKEERAAMNQHVVIGHQIVQSVPFLSPTADVLRHHHERFDGTGYPDRLKGFEIPALARIFAVADAFDAMTSPRPYRPQPLTMDQARAVIERETERQFCPQAAGAFLTVPVSDLERIRADSMAPMHDLSVLVKLTGTVHDPVERFYRDSLTQVQNRAAWEIKQKQMAHTRGEALGTVVFVDMDLLKAVNDTHGHATGDRVLADLGARLRQICSNVYRLGGDEFVMWFPTADWVCHGQERFEAMLAHFSEYWSDLAPQVSVSWGAASACKQARCLSELMDQADRAMYAHKGSRENRRNSGRIHG